MNNFTQMIKGIKDPKQAVFQMLSNNTNPIAKNLLEMAKNNDTKGIEEFARNYTKEQGKDFDTEFPKFMNQFK